MIECTVFHIFLLLFLILFLSLFFCVCVCTCPTALIYQLSNIFEPNSFLREICNKDDDDDDDRFDKANHCYSLRKYKSFIRLFDGHLQLKIEWIKSSSFDPYLAFLFVGSSFFFISLVNFFSWLPLLLLLSFCVFIYVCVSSMSI